MPNSQEHERPRTLVAARTMWSRYAAGMAVEVGYTLALLGAASLIAWLAMLVTR